jgi:hypothetical protein
MNSFGTTERQNSGLRNEGEKKLYLSDIVNYQKRLSLLEKMAKMEAERKKGQDEEVQAI